MNLLRKYYEAEDRQGGGELEPVIILAEEVWDFNSALIGRDIDDLQYYVGRAVMLEHDFKESCEQIFKGYASQLSTLQEENRKLRDVLKKLMEQYEIEVREIGYHTQHNETLEGWLNDLPTYAEAKQLLSK